MQFAVQDIRRWGNKKIASYFFQSLESKDAFFNRLKVRNMMLSDIKCSAYSLPKVYNKLYKNINSEYTGMVRFVDMCEPLMLSIDKPDLSIQRKFRNQWDTLWKAFGRDVGISQDLVSMLKELGVRLCFCYTDSGDNIDSLVSGDLGLISSQEVFEFYNAVLSWYVISFSESNIQSLGLAYLDLVERLVLMTSEEFLSSLDKSSSIEEEG